MKKVNFQKIEIKNIKNETEIADFAKLIGNQLYMNGRTIEECELGKRIYYAEGDVELNEKECEMVKGIISGYSYIARTSIEKAINA